MIAFVYYLNYVSCKSYKEIWYYYRLLLIVIVYHRRQPL